MQEYNYQKTIATSTAWSVSFFITTKIEMINDGAEESHIKSHYLILLVCRKENNKLINK